METNSIIYRSPHDLPDDLLRLLVVGRSPDCGVVLPDSATTASGEHLGILPDREPGLYELQDMGSRNGSFILNDRKGWERFARILCGENECLSLGTFKVTLRELLTMARQQHASGALASLVDVFKRPHSVRLPGGDVRTRMTDPPYPDDFRLRNAGQRFTHEDK